MSERVHVYMCTNAACRYVERQGGVKKTTLGKCQRCGKGELTHRKSE